MIGDSMSPPSERRVLIAILGLATVLRIVHLTWGLPSLLEEAMPLRRAMQMIRPDTGAIDLNPHFFHYPSLSIYLHLAGALLVQLAGRLLGWFAPPADFLLAFQIDPTPMVVVGRAIHVAADVSCVWASFRIARRVSLPCAALSALLVAFSWLLIRTQNTIIVDTLAGALLAWSLERTFAWQASGRTRNLVVASLLLGLACSVKYPAIAFAGALLYSILSGARKGRWTLLAIAAGTAVAAFVLTSPYIVLDARHALGDIAFEQQHLAMGHLGGQTPGHLLRNLAPLLSLGPLGLLLLCLSPVLLREAPARPFVGPALIAFVLLAVPAVMIRLDAERYLAPAIPMAAFLVAVTATAIASRTAPRLRSAAIGGIALLTLLPVFAGGVAAALRGTDDTQRLALAWCRQHVPTTAFVVEEGWTAPLVSRIAKIQAAGSAEYRLASPALRSRFDRIPAYHVVSVPSWVTGAFQPPPHPGEPERPRQAIDLNQMYYRPSLYRAADFFITSASVRGRYLADPGRFAAQARFYGLLDRAAERVATFAPSFGVSGPVITVYRLTGAFHRAATDDSLPMTWWIPDSPPTATEGPSDPARWRHVWESYFRTFATELALESFGRGDTLTTESLVTSALAADSTDLDNAVLYSSCLEGRGALDQARAVLHRALAANPEYDAPLRAQLARLGASRVAAQPARRPAH